MSANLSQSLFTLLSYNSFGVESLESSDIYLSSKIAVTQSKWYVSELDVLKVYCY